MEKDDTTYAIRSITFLTIEHARVGVVCLIVEDLGMLKRVREGDCLPVLSPRYGMFCLLAIDRVVIGTHSELSDQRRPYDVELTLSMARLLCQYSSCSQLNVLVLTSSGAVLAGAEWAKWVIWDWNWFVGIDNVLWPVEVAAIRGSEVRLGHSGDFMKELDGSIGPIPLRREHLQ
jgi:hypothetical protein